MTRSLPYDLGFIGAGNMAEAIARASIQQGVVPADRIIASDPAPGRRSVFESLGVKTTDQNDTAITDSEHVLLAIKPQTLAQIGVALGAMEGDDRVVMSIMAGITTDRIEATIGRPTRIVRIMPNTPLMVGQGMAAVALGPHAQPGDDDLALKLFGAAGEAIRVPERLLDGITAVSGSGPAYLFYLAEAMEEAARELGLAEHAPLLVRQTILGAAQLLSQSDDGPATLRQKVTSPGGTTEAAIKHLDGNATTQVIVNAIKAAEKRSRELGG